MINCLTLE